MTESTDKETSKEESESNKSDESEDNKTDISAELGGVRIDVSTEGEKDCEELFYRVWDYIMDDAEEMSDALQGRLNS